MCNYSENKTKLYKSMYIGTARQQLGIEEYSFSQVTLEQIFIELVRSAEMEA
jgi:hypothetical protein